MDDLASLQQNLQSALMASTRSVNSLASEDLQFYRAIDPSLGRKVDAQIKRLLKLGEKLMDSMTAGTETTRPRLKNIDAVDDNWRDVVEVIDSNLERADTALDEFTGAVKRLTPSGEPTPAAKPNRQKFGNKEQEIEKPQLKFENVPTNREEGPFKPLLLSKPHAKHPMLTSPTLIGTHGHLLEYEHPYWHEIQSYEYPARVYTYAKPVPYHPFESTTAIFVDTEEELDKMLQELKDAREIAIDLEHHDKRSYIGIVSLMQISTRDQDWIVDTLQPWRRNLQCLNQVFADPDIVKVLHGAFMDVIWLQRDLGLYLVGLFDTYYACQALGYPRHNLAFLLKKFADVDAQKQYQTADWRVRPLPKELFDYARSDTHYLLYIFDCMRNELIEKSNFSIPNRMQDRIHSVLQQSNETARQRYEICEHQVYEIERGQGPMGWFKTFQRIAGNFTEEQFAVFRAVHKWRDDVARDQDDSPHFILPQHSLGSIVRSIPQSKVELLNIVHWKSETVRLRADELIAVIKEAQKTKGPAMADVLRKADPDRKYHLGARGGRLLVGEQARLQGEAPQQSNASPSNLPIRSLKSAFWGRTLDDSAGGDQVNRSAPDSSQLRVPLPPITGEMFANEIATASTPTATAAVQTKSSLPQPTEGLGDDSDVFTLKQMGKKRKSTHTEPPDMLAAQTSEISVDSATEKAKDSKSASRAGRRARKRAKRDMERSENERLDNSLGSGNTSEQGMFDYENAPDMLTPQGQMNANSKQGLKGAKVEKEKHPKHVNPYAKALDAPKGLPKVQKERAGKSMTFKE